MCRDNACIAEKRHIVDAVCCTHLLHELTGIWENYLEQKWASVFIDLLLEMKKAKAENPLSGTVEKNADGRKKGKILSFAEHLAVYKVSGCIRTEEGAKDYLKVMSYIRTTHKQGYNAYEVLKKAISGHPDFIFE